MATAAAAVVAKARRDVLSHFMQANATSPETAVGYEPGRRIRRRQFERLIDAAVIRAAPDDRYWLDVPRYDGWSRARRKRAGVAIGAVAVIGALVGLLAA